MADIESGNNAESNNQSSNPPRRRRAASRPAGPPPEVAAAAQAPTAENQPEAAENQPEAAEKPKRTRRATRSSSAKTSEPTPVVATDRPDQGESAPAPTRRRRASRPAGATTVVAEQVPTQAAVLESPAGETALIETAAEQTKPTRRRRASRATAAPAEPQTELVVTEATAPAEQLAPSTSQEAATKPARRRRASRAAAAPEVSQETSSQTGAAELVAGAESAAPVIESQPESGRRGRGRRGSRKPATAAPVVETAEVATDTEPIDGIAAALQLAEQAAARRNLVSDPFAVTRDQQAQLAELAGVIAADEDETEIDDADAEEAEILDGETEQDVAEGEEAETAEDEDRPSRRRRRRGGRRRRKGGRDEADEASEAEEDSAESEAPSETEDAAEQDAESGTTRRRRRRRRRGEDGETRSGDDEISGIEGSTRMEAKRQRRRENRAAGRRRAPILSEAEFLARRESVDRKLVIRQSPDYTQLAVVEDGILVEHYVDRESATSLIGNIYLGKVQNVLPSMEAAFVDIGRGRNAVLYAGEVDWDSFGVTAEDRKVEKVFKSGQAVLVQVTKDPVGAKGARLTGHISLPGRYIVYSPGGHLSGISRKLPDAERARLREILGELITDEESVIVRTAAEGTSSEELVRDVNRLKAQWEVIEKKVKQGKAPVALYSEPDLTLRIVRDLFTEDFGKLIVQGDGGPEDAFDAISAYVSHVAPNLAERVEKFEQAEGGADLFAEYRIDEQIAKALDRKVYLPSGGSLVIDRTEAMTVIDVNTGRFTGTGGNLEATVTSNNLEAAEEIVRQLRLRDLGGIIVIDFIDMVLPSNRELLLRRLIECLGRDRTRHQVAEVTSLGLVQLTRKRIGTGLAEAFTAPCEHCAGSGYLRSDEPVDSQAPADGGDRKPGKGSGKGRRRSEKKSD